MKKNSINEDPVPLKRHQALVSFSKEHHFVIAGMENKAGLFNVVNGERIGNYVLFFFNRNFENSF